MSPERFVIDTSAWISSFKKSGSPQVKEFLINSVRSGAATTAPIIILELLQGCRTEEERDALRLNLESLDVLPIGLVVWDRSYQLGFSLRKKGLTIPTVDLIVAAIAIENDCIVLHQDRHYEMIARHSTLRTMSFG